ncbi:uncharacterized protein ACLA_023010 [Aspergillus clavatus NRRL 1]|uniref:Uncharacterized protein n=1 Tax=Aspergillus clavatus (strain ATCC 1007 / CBS 513.65 / DSM 816 / NCTC 3887 / NRRL 1 / QM 1276 / 107) TaxID=344612 RepID=A1CPL6_ASPCL|nr:uncharacterized protein ACLA_023010 [Aspergillus clavatus NRRL 1]EAW07587.1 hypothetical protein ACLA_023010 [Aspergillus clavatus NRRL 1]
MDQNIGHILADRSDWPSWYKRIRLVALSKEVWPYIDPDSKEPPCLPLEPQRPAYGDFQLGAQRYSSLEDRNRMDYDHALATWRWTHDDWRRVRGDVAYVALLIASSVSRFAHDLIVDEDDPREMLVTLKRRMIPHPLPHLFIPPSHHLHRLLIHIQRPSQVMQRRIPIHIRRPNVHRTPVKNCLHRRPQRPLLPLFHRVRAQCRLRATLARRDTIASPTSGKHATCNSVWPSAVLPAAARPPDTYPATQRRRSGSCRAAAKWRTCTPKTGPRHRFLFTVTVTETIRPHQPSRLVRASGPQQLEHIDIAVGRGDLQRGARGTRA